MSAPLTGSVRLVEGAGEPQQRRLEREGWQAALMRDGGVTHRSLLAAIGRALHFPSHYGHNLDALWDCLTDLQQPTALVWEGWQQAAVADPGDWARIMQVLRERTDEPEPPFTLVLCTADRSPDLGDLVPPEDE